MERLFITGGTGYLGSALIRLAAVAGYALGASHFSHLPPPGHAVAWTALDIRDALAVDAALAQFRPDCVIHTAFQQSGPELMAITAIGAAHVARAAIAHGARLVHLSSDVIFDGARVGAYHEADKPNPISDYGVAKAKAEELVAAAHPGAAIVRTSLIYGFDPIDRQTQFVLDVAAGLRNDSLFSDEYRCPIFVDDLAAALLELAATEYAGVLHVAGSERVSRYELGTLMAQACGQSPVGIRAALSSTSPQRRPRNCTLDTRRARAMLTTRLRGVRELLHDLGRENVY